MSGSSGSAPASGKSTLMPCVRSGAVIMKMMSNTSITSMYGTTLISPMSLRPRLRVDFGISDCPRGRVPLQDGGEFLHEGVVTQLEASDLIGVTVVGDHRRDGSKQAHGGRDQGFGDPGRDHRQGGLLHITQRMKRIHNAPDGTEQADIRTGRADSRKHREIVFEPIDFAHLRDAHRALRTLQKLRGRHAALL